jgi:hypothetical protein
MNFILRVGLPRSTKTYAMVQDMYETLKRNKKWYDKRKIKEKRYVISNIHLNVSKEYEEFIKYFSDENTFKRLVIEAHDCDIFIDEVSIYFDADNYANIPLDYKRFLNEYARRGNTLQATTQDASQLLKRARRKVTNIYHHKKLIGNPSPSPTRPKIKHIWGLFIAIPSHFEMSPDGELEVKRSSYIPIFGFLRRFGVELYDTRQEIKKLKFQVLNHYEYRCEHYDDEKHSCNFVKIVHK